MADHCSSIEAWTYRSAFTDSSGWIAGTFARENEALTEALKISLSDDSSASETLSSAAYLPPIPFTDAESLIEPTKPSVRSSNTSIACSPLGKISKRKSRVSKRSITTYINADPANFRRMVQEVTGIRNSDDALPMDPVTRPEFQRVGNSRGGKAPGSLPTLDTSALLLDWASVSFPPALGGAPPVNFDALPSFPTLESWAV